MKMIMLIASLISLEMVGQEIPVNDPGYSTHNYKNFNKAAAVAKRDTNSGIRVSFDETNRDYKKPASKNKENVLRIFRPIGSDNFLRKKSYKTPNG